MSDFKDDLRIFNEVIEKCEVMTFITRASNLQKKALVELKGLIRKVSKSKKIAIKAQNNDEANAYLSLECIALCLSCVIKMWLLLKEDKPDLAWIELINAQDHAISSYKAHAISSHIEGYIEHLYSIEKTVFPPQVFMSSGITAKEEECSICGECYEDCEHLIGKPYLGKFCHVVIKELSINEISIVNDPADKRCRVTHFSVPEGTKNRMTWSIEPNDDK